MGSKKRFSQRQNDLSDFRNLSVFVDITFLETSLTMKLGSKSSLRKGRQKKKTLISRSLWEYATVRQFFH
jgi:hypothetical protein